MVDLEEAITYYRHALTFLSTGHPHRPGSLHNLAGAISTRFEHLGRVEDLEEAITHLSEAEASSPTDHPLHVMIRRHLAAHYLALYNLNPSLDHYLTTAFTLFGSAANHTTASLKVRFAAALQWASTARYRQHESTIRAYSMALTLLDRCLVTNPSLESQQKFLASSTVPNSLASDAAASAIEAEQLESAVELLEQGRTILWSKMRGYRHPLKQLGEVNEELANRFETLSGQLERHAISSESEPTASLIVSDSSSISFDVKMRRHRILSEEWDDILKRIRQIDGFTDFLQVVPFTTLQTVAAEGPVIIVNISEYRSDAIILHRGGPPVLIPLPEASPEHLTYLSSQLPDGRGKNARRVILPILRSLWDSIVCPVRDELATLGVAEQSRIWWCPTSELCALPLHAAGPYTSGERNLPDIYISSYTPTLSMLIGARSNIVRRSAIPKLLVMGQPGDNIEAAMLPGAREELRRIHSFGDFVDILVAREADRHTVLSSLQQHSWIHFACYGHQALQPFHSFFQLHDEERLTLIDLLQARLPNAEFAFLSACHSAAGDIHSTPDEVIHLAAALQFCGFRSVVGTLWAMADIDGPDIAEDFYRYMFRESSRAVDFKDSAMALNQAIKAMRKRKGMTVDRWINFIHIGA